MDEPVEEEQQVDELEQVTRQRDEYLDALQRLKAEFDNYRKRVARDQGDLVARASERLPQEPPPSRTRPPAPRSRPARHAAGALPARPAPRPRAASPPPPEA